MRVHLAQQDGVKTDGEGHTGEFSTCMALDYTSHVKSTEKAIELRDQQRAEHLPCRGNLRLAGALHVWCLVQVGSAASCLSLRQQQSCQEMGSSCAQNGEVCR